MSLADTGEDGRPSPDDVRAKARQVLLSGAAVTIPVIVTLVVLGFVVNFVSRTLDPVVSIVTNLFGLAEVPDFLLKGVTVGLLVALVFVVGLAAERRSGDGRIEEAFDQAIARIPGIGSVYTSFNEMSEMLIQDETDSFREVKLVEYPTEGSFVVAFLTATTPDSIGDVTGYDDMVTLFMPMAPNPVMGGFVIHVDEDRVYDVDMSVEEGIRSIVTSGVAIGETQDHALDSDRLSQLITSDRAEQMLRPDEPARGETVDDYATDRAEEYDRDLSPEFVRTPDGIAERERDDDTIGEDALTPDELERRRRDDTSGDATDDTAVDDTADSE
ncbi:MAG: DUF502 domain-containing protein [Haloarculaceae archaeon]